MFRFSLPIRALSSHLAIDHDRLAPIFLALLMLVMTPLPVSADCHTLVGKPVTGAGLQPGERHMHIRLLASLRLWQAECKSLPLMGLSALAWSADTGLLYALSDRGHIFHLRPRFSAGRLDNLELVDAFPLRSADGKPLGVTDGDSEGMALINGDNTIAGDEQLLISFERRPRVSRYRAYGLWLADLDIAPQLTAIDHYRTPNQALEGVVMHPRWGLLLAVERPLANRPETKFGIYDSDGLLVSVPRTNQDYGSLTDIAVGADQGLLTLERIFSGIFGIVAAVIRRIDPATGRSEILVRLDKADGHVIDNFEGLTHHSGNRYFLVSDNNGRAIQQTLLYYFELVK